MGVGRGSAGWKSDTSDAACPSGHWSHDTSLLFASEFPELRGPGQARLLFTWSLIPVYPGTNTPGGVQDEPAKEPGDRQELSPDPVLFTARAVSIVGNGLPFLNGARRKLTGDALWLL